MMNRRQVVWFMAMVMLTLLVVVSAPAFPQEQPPPQQPATEEPDTAAVEQILQEQEQALQGQRFSYDPGGRRDPFLNLFTTLGTPGTKRPRGVAGMLVNEINLVGLVKEGSGEDMALLIGSDNKGYFLKVGDGVYDGTMIAIDPRLGTVTFRQKVDDPRLIKPYRDIVKKLVQLDDEESANE